MTHTVAHTRLPLFSLFIENRHYKVRILPWDDCLFVFFQICSLRFGSWAFDGGELDMVVDHSETGVKKGTYQNNTEWEMMKVTVERKEVSIKMFCL